MEWFCILASWVALAAWALSERYRREEAEGKLDHAKREYVDRGLEMRANYDSLVQRADNLAARLSRREADVGRLQFEQERDNRSLDEVEKWVTSAPKFIVDMLPDDDDFEDDLPDDDDDDFCECDPAGCCECG